MAAELKIKSGGSWRTITAPEVKVLGSWRAITSIEVKSAGVWRSVFSSAPVVSLGIGGVSNINFGATCFAGVRFNSDGTEQASTAAGSFSVSRGNWLDSGNAADVWIERIINSGSLSWQDSGAGRLNMATTRTFGNQDPTNDGNDVVTGMTFNMWDAASGGNLLDTVTYNLVSDFSVI